MERIVASHQMLPSATIDPLPVVGAAWCPSAVVLLKLKKVSTGEPQILKVVVGATMWSVAEGVDVPIPTFPLGSMRKRVLAAAASSLIEKVFVLVPASSSDSANHLLRCIGHDDKTLEARAWVVLKRQRRHTPWLYQGSVADRFEYMQLGTWCRSSDADIPLNNRAAGRSDDVIGTITDRDATACGSALMVSLDWGLLTPIPTFCAAALDAKSKIAEAQAANHGRLI
jgi:hypothetical protein